MSNPFEMDLKAIRQRARAQMEKGAVTQANTGDVKQTIKVLNEALATEIVCVLRYRNHYFMASGVRGQVVAQEFLEHAGEEQEHADRIAARIVELGGAPDLNPVNLAARSHTEYKEGDTLKSAIVEDLVAERIAIETYSEIIRWLGDKDPTTRRLLESILEKEEEHAKDMAELLQEQ